MSLPSQAIAWDRLERDVAGPAHRPDARRRLRPAGRARGARRGRGRGARLRGAPAPSSSRCRPFMTRAMADGMDRLLAHALVARHLGARRRAARARAALHRRVGARRRGPVRRARLPRLQPDGRDARSRRGRLPRRSTSCCRRPRRSRPSPPMLPSPTNDPARPFEHIAFTLPFNMSEQPAASINCGYTAERPADRPADRRPAPRRPRRAAGRARLGADAARRRAPWPEPPQR